MSLRADMEAMGKAARAAAAELAGASTQAKNNALLAMAAAIRLDAETIAKANARDVEAATARDVKGSFLDRLTLTPDRVEAMAQGLEAIARLPDPVGAVMAHWQRDDGLDFTRVRVPIGVIGIIYESRPNVTADAGALCLKSGNACILRGGSDSFHSATAIAQCLQAGLRQADLPQACIQMVQTADREAVGLMLEGLSGTLDLIVPRGGKSLVERVQKDARIPVFSHLDGNNHVYIHASADADMARNIILNAKLRRTGVCGAAETLLIDRACAAQMLPPILQALHACQCEIRGDAEVIALDALATAATEEDWATEYLDAILAVHIVSGLDEAITHIARFGSHHTDAIVATEAAAAERFLNEVDSAIVLHNASTQFADGGEFGFGAEIGIATGRLHARGPVGLEQLTTFKYQLRGTGHVRP
ncbi:MAG: glutamate-5-semialdehyde dehydrogenase [Aestuariivirgaceae bacterium]|nr:glutamate-5-semialdehyde dehydrogenase [Aestuariivirgaceae bacterium]